MSTPSDKPVSPQQAARAARLAAALRTNLRRRKAAPRAAAEKTPADDDPAFPEGDEAS